MISTRREWLHRVATCPWHPGISTVRYPIPERIFDYVSTVQSATAGTCHKRNCESDASTSTYKGENK